MSADPKISIYCVGNRLMLDDGLGYVVYEELTRSYEFPENVAIHDVGCMSLAMIEDVNASDYMITIDAVDGTDSEPGTVFEYLPSDIASRTQINASLHELTLTDLFDAASLLGYECNGKCFGIQVVNGSPEVATIALSRPVYESIPTLVEAVLADLLSNGITVYEKRSGLPVKPGHSHEMTE